MSGLQETLHDVRCEEKILQRQLRQKSRQEIVWVSEKDLTNRVFLRNRGPVSVGTYCFCVGLKSAFNFEHVPLVLVHSVISQFGWGGKGSVAYSALV